MRYWHVVSCRPRCRPEIAPSLRPFSCSPPVLSPKYPQSRTGRSGFPPIFFLGNRASGIRNRKCSICNGKNNSSGGRHPCYFTATTVRVGPFVAGVLNANPFRCAKDRAWESHCGGPAAPAKSPLPTAVAMSPSFIRTPPYSRSLLSPHLIM